MIIYRATGVINFAQGGLVLLGAYLDLQRSPTGGLPFLLAVRWSPWRRARWSALVIERLVLRRMVGQPVFAVIMITSACLSSSSRS